MSNPSPSAGLINKVSLFPDGRIQPDRFSAADDFIRGEAGAVARECFGLAEPRLERLEGGRVNETFLVTAAGWRFVLQRLNDFFLGHEALGVNWHRVYQAVAERSGSAEPPLPPVLPDRKGRFLTPWKDAGFWRLTGFLEGAPAPKTPAGAREAAGLLGMLHRTLNFPAPLELMPPPEGEFTNQRLTRPEDFERLSDQFRGHPRLEELKPVIEEGAEAAGQLSLRPGLVLAFSQHDVVIHGDPKADNFLFSPSPSGRTAIALLDWDSVGYGHVLVDVAEMLRSWGATAGPEGPGVDFDSLAAVAEGYAGTGLTLEREDLELLPTVLRGIALNLGRRYLTDALAEIYFKWDPRAYPSLYDQNRARGQAMLRLADHLLDQEMRLIELLEAAYARGSAGPV